MKKTLLSGLILLATFLLTSCGVPEMTEENAKTDKNDPDSPQSTVGNGGDMIASYLHEVRFEASMAIEALTPDDLNLIVDRKLIHFLQTYKYMMQDDLEFTRHDWIERKDDVNGSCGHVRSEDHSVVFFSPNPCKASFQSFTEEEKKKYALIFLVHETVHHFGNELRSLGVEVSDEEHFAEEVGRYVYKLGATKLPSSSDRRDIPAPQPGDGQAQPAPIPSQPVPGNEIPRVPVPIPTPTSEECAKSPTVSANCDNLDSIKMDYQYIGLMYNAVDKRSFWSAGNDTDSVSNALLERCQEGSGSPGHCVGNLAVSNDCVAIAINPLDESGWSIGSGSTPANAMSVTKRSCLDRNPSCEVRFTYCAL